MPAESQASQRVRHIAKAPANPFLFVYERNTMTARLRRERSASSNPCSGAYMDPTGFLSDRARPRAKECQVHSPDRFSMGEMQIFHLSTLSTK